MAEPRASRRITIVAEIGENHVGDMERAKEMILAAAAAGVDAVKFQSFLASEVHDADPEKAWFSGVQLSDEIHFELKTLAQQQGVEFFSAPFSLNRARFLCEKLGLQKIKIASSEMLNFPLLDYVAEKAQQVYLSTGLATLEETGQAVRHLASVPEVTLLHCVAVYPTQDHEANLRAIGTLQQAFPGQSVGFSDHTLGICASVAAAALGATVIEKHFTLDKTLPGTDHLLSADPQELRQMVEMIRRIELLLGEPVKQPTPREQEVLELVRGRFPKGAPAGS